MKARQLPAAPSSSSAGLPGLDPVTLSRSRAAWRRAAWRNGYLTMAFSVSMFVLLATLSWATADSSVKSGENPSIKTIFRAGISDADAVVIVTSMLLLVASLSIVVAAGGTGSRQQLVEHIVETAMWHKLVAVISVVASGLSLTVALTRSGSDASLAAVLIIMAVLAIFTAVSTLRRTEDEVPTVLRIHDSQARLERLAIIRDWTRAQFGRRHSSVWRSVLSCATLVLTSSAVTVLSIVLTVFIREATPLSDIPNEIAGALVVLTLIAVIVILPAWFLCVTTAAVWSRRWQNTARPSERGSSDALGRYLLLMWQGARVLVCVMWIALAGSELFADSATTTDRLISLWLTIIPLLVPSLLCTAAYRWNLGPGRGLIDAVIRWLESDYEVTKSTLDREQKRYLAAFALRDSTH